MAASTMTAGGSTTGRRLLYVSDAVAHTGLARVTANLCRRLQARGWDVHVLGVNYHGDPHTEPFPVYPAATGGDTFGVRRVAALCDRLKPDVVLVTLDPWLVADFLGRTKGVPLVGYMPIDGRNTDPDVATKLSDLDLAIWYTHFAQREAEAAGYVPKRPSRVIYHGVDRTLYRPMDRMAARERLGLTTVIGDRFVVGCVNRNQPRKRLDLLMQAFRRFLDATQAEAYLYLHAAIKDLGPDLLRVARYYGIEPRLILTSRDLRGGHGVEESEMVAIYNAMDVHVSTALGEGFGLTTLESMACGVPQIVPAFAALGEWPGDAVIALPIAGEQAAPHLSTVGGVVDVDAVAAALRDLYEAPGVRATWGRRAHARAQAPDFDWDQIAAAFDEALTGLLEDVRAHATPLEIRTPPAHWWFRVGTQDAHVWDECVTRNVYRLPPRFEDGAVVIDIGANSGAFAYAAQARGARVLAFEPHPENAELAAHNLRPYEQRVTLVRWAVWAKDGTERVAVSAVPVCGRTRATGGVTTAPLGTAHAPGTLVAEALDLDAVILGATDGGARRVALVKLDCEGAEYGILATAERLDLVDAIVGEYHLAGVPLPDPVPEAWQARGLAACTGEALKACLEARGFAVRLTLHADGRNGEFYATREGGPA